MNKHAFTLIEILVSMTIFMSVMALMGNVFYRTNKVTRQSLSVLEMFQRSEGVNRLITSDFEYLLSTCAIHIDTDQDLKTITFMSSTVHNPNQDSGYSGASSKFTYDVNRDNGLTWVRWEWDNTTGVVKRGTSRRTTMIPTQLLTVNDISRGQLQENNRRPTPQQHYIYFEGDPNTAITNTFNNPRKTRHQLSEEVVEIVANNTFSQNGDIDLRFRNEFQNYYLCTLAVIGDNNGKISPDVYAVRNPDGVSYNKDKANLVGADNNDHYPTQLSEITNKIELFYIELLKRDAATRISVSDEDDTLGDGSNSIDISGVDISGRYAQHIEKRPGYANVSYLLHDIPYDTLGENSNDPLITELRDRVLNDATLSDPDTAIDIANRRQALIDLIEDFGYSAIIVFRSIRLPL